MRYLLLVAMILTCGANAATKKSTRSPQRYSIALSELEVRRHILLSGEYLISQIKPDGRFIYRQHLDPEIKYTRNLYNVLRHAGTLAALGEYYKSFPALSIKHKVLLSANYLIKNYIKPIPGYTGVYAVVSKPGEMSSGKLPVAKLGGTGLALTALAPLYQLDKRIISLKKLQGMGKFLVFMQKPNGSAHSKYYPTTKKFSNWKSLYYPGEAALGLLCLYDIDKDKIWFRFAKQYLLYLARSRKGKKNVEADHWSLLATQKIFQTGKKQLKDSEVVLLQNHAKQVLTRILNTQNMSKQNNLAYGSFNSSTRTCPAATRMEGIIAGYKFVKDKTLKKRLIKSISAGMYFLLNAQHKDGILKGGTPRALSKLVNSTQNRSYNQRVGEIRIDYVQHSMCAMIEYLKLLNR
jgi:hypothetical protein